MINLGSPELIVIVIILLIVFGTGRVTEAARTLGKAKREADKFQKEVAGVTDVLQNPLDTLLAPPPKEQADAANPPAQTDAAPPAPADATPDAPSAPVKKSS